MTKAEFGMIADAIRTFYPKEQILPNELAMNLWYEQLKDINYKVISIALTKWVATSKWSPSIADLRGMVADIVEPCAKTWGEAWEEASRAVRRFGYMQEEEALKTLDEVTRQCVKRIGFQTLCLSENESVERANFRMIYEQEIEKRKYDASLPEKVKRVQEQVVKALEGG